MLKTLCAERENVEKKAKPGEKERSKKLWEKTNSTKKYTKKLLIQKIMLLKKYSEINNVVIK